MAVGSKSPLSDKVALITGAGSGIGRATAHAMAGAGARVVVADLSAEGGNQTVNELRRVGYEAMFVQVDVTSEEQVRQMIDTTLQSYGRLDVLHNNAGVIETHRDIVDVTLEAWQRIIDIDLTGEFLGCKYGVPALRKSGGGAIVNTASNAGLHGFMGALHYSVAKGGIVVMTRCLADLLKGENIRVNCICPTTVDTPLAAIGDTPEGREKTALPPGYEAMKKLRPEDIARLALFLATKARFTGGAVQVGFAADGGPKYSVTFDYKYRALRVV